MDQITHTILAVAVIACAYYGGRWQQVREARRMFGDIASPEMLKHMQQLDRLIEQMTFEDERVINHQQPSATEEPSVTQLELFREYGEYGYSPSE